jgi:hypothetical protein
MIQFFASRGELMCDSPRKQLFEHYLFSVNRCFPEPT